MFVFAEITIELFFESNSRIFSYKMSFNETLYLKPTSVQNSGFYDHGHCCGSLNVLKLRCMIWTNFDQPFFAISLQQCSKSIQLHLVSILLANQVPECSKSYLRAASNFKRFLHFVMASGTCHQRLHLNYLNSLLFASPCFPEIFLYLEFDFPRRHLTNSQLTERF
jgi:hypothetical protein